VVFGQICAFVSCKAEMLPICAEGDIALLVDFFKKKIEVKKNLFYETLFNCKNN